MNATVAALAQVETLDHRKIPCICPRQFEPSPPLGVMTDIAVSRGIVIETVSCSTCDRKWRRVNL